MLQDGTYTVRVAELKAPGGHGQRRADPWGFLSPEIVARHGGVELSAAMAGIAVAFRALPRPFGARWPLKRRGTARRSWLATSASTSRSRSVNSSMRARADARATRPSATAASITHPPSAIRSSGSIVIADDAALVRDGVAALLRRIPGANG
jgi:hypothetical protein